MLLLVLVGNIIEGISFMLFMLDCKLGDIILSHADNQKEDSRRPLVLVYSRVIAGPACEGVGHRNCEKK